MVLLCNNVSHWLGANPGGVLPMWWVIHMCRGFDPLFSLWQDRARSFWGIFSHPPTPKRSFGVLKLPILKEFDLLGPKFHFSLDLFGSNFHRPAAHPHQFSDRVPPPGRKPRISPEINLIAQQKTAATPVLLYWSYHCLMQSAKSLICFSGLCPVSYNGKHLTMTSWLRQDVRATKPSIWICIRHSGVVSCL